MIDEFENINVNGLIQSTMDEKSTFWHNIINFSVFQDKDNALINDFRRQQEIIKEIRIRTFKESVPYDNFQASRLLYGSSLLVDYYYEKKLGIKKEIITEYFSEAKTYAIRGMKIEFDGALKHLDYYCQIFKDNPCYPSYFYNELLELEKLIKTLEEGGIREQAGEFIKKYSFGGGFDKYFINTCVESKDKNSVLNLAERIYDKILYLGKIVVEDKSNAKFINKVFEENYKWYIKSYYNIPNTINRMYCKIKVTKTINILMISGKDVHTQLENLNGDYIIPVIYTEKSGNREYSVQGLYKRTEEDKYEKIH